MKFTTRFRPKLFELGEGYSKERFFKDLGAGLTVAVVALVATHLLLVVVVVVALVSFLAQTLDRPLDQVWILVIYQTQF